MQYPSPDNPQFQIVLSEKKRKEILHGLFSSASEFAHANFNAYSQRLAETFFSQSEASSDSKQANLSFNVANLLKNNSYAFYHLATEQIRHSLQSEQQALEKTATPEIKNQGGLALVSLEEMENKVSIGSASRLFEIEQADLLSALNIRLACLIHRDSFSVAQNPFRPEVFLTTIYQAWCEFDQDTDSHHLILPLLKPEFFLPLGSLYETLNNTLIAEGILPELVESYRIKKSDGNVNTPKPTHVADSALLQQLRRLFSDNPSAPIQATATANAMMAKPDFAQHAAQLAATTQQLIDYLVHLNNSSQAHNPNLRLADIKQQLPAGAMSRVDETTIDLLAKIFDAVFQDRHIPAEMKNLIGFLQVPVLKTALIDKEFFYTETHPARRLIDLLTKTSISWNQDKGLEDPLYQTMKRQVDRIQQQPEQDSALFSTALADLEAYLAEDDKLAQDALTMPINQALKQEKLRQATKAAREEVTARISTGEVAAFVEAFLENRWVPVLTLAYSVQDKKPQAVENAVKTMDDLIWSIKPKFDLKQRKELITRLPTILGMLNNWLNVIKWEDADRLQFFADLAECHASIVRAPLDMAPERQLKIALRVAQKAAERRLVKRSNELPEPEPDAFVQQVEQLKRGMWLESRQDHEAPMKVKLAWVSPMRSLYIFSTGQNQEAFSLPAEELAQRLRDGRMQLIVVERLVDRVLSETLQSAEMPEESMA